MTINIPKNKAFTMVEIVLVIGVLGLVAVMTLPEMVENIKDRTFNTASKTYLLKLQEIGRQMSLEDELTEYPTNEQFADAFVKYIKVVKRCNSSNLNQCFVSEFRTGSDEIVTTSNLKTSADLKTFNNAAPLVGFALLNGTTAIMAYDPNCVINDADKYNTATPKTYCMSMIYDINASSGPNKMGKDILTLNASITDCDGAKIGSLCIAAGDTTYASINTCNDSTYDSNLTANVYCSKNAWAGAKKACIIQGMRLPSQAELGTIYQNRESISGLDTTSFYWSSTESDVSSALLQLFSGGVSSSGKGNAINARCVK